MYTASSNLDLDLSVTFRPRSNVEFSMGIDWTRQIIDRTKKIAFEGFTYQGHLHYQITRQLFLSSRLKGESRDDQYNLDILFFYRYDLIKKNQNKIPLHKNHI